MNEKYLKYINDNQLVSHMNKTKWSELADSLSCSEIFEPTVRVRHLGDEVDPEGFSLLDWEWVKNGNSSVIEWMDIDPLYCEYRGQLVKDKATDYSEFIEGVLNRHSIPFSINGIYYRVWGYSFPNQQPQFA